MRFAWMIVHARHLVAVEVGLLNHAVLRGDFAEECKTGAERRRAFELLARHLRIHDCSGVDGGVHAANFHFSVSAHFHLNDGGYVRQKAAVNSDAHTATLAHRTFAPA